jgi:hypothetical protein
MGTKNQIEKRPASPSPCCRSGNCPNCLETSRWERLFERKFADPDYYGSRLTFWSITPLAGSFIPYGGKSLHSQARKVGVAVG